MDKRIVAVALVAVIIVAAVAVVFVASPSSENKDVDGATKDCNLWVYGNVNGDNYITAEPLYKTVERYYLRAKSDVLGEQIKLYKLPDENSEIIDFVGEGAVLELTEPYNENSEFLQIRYNKSIAYVRTRNIQKDGLTEGQKFALCFAGTIVGITAIFGILTLVVKKRRKE